MQHIHVFNVDWRLSVTETHLTSILGTDVKFPETFNKGHKSMQMKNKNVYSHSSSGPSQRSSQYLLELPQVTSIPPHYTHDSINNLISKTNHGHQQHPPKRHPSEGYPRK